MTGNKPSILIVYFSWTQTVQTVAMDLKKHLDAAGDVTLAAIQPVRERSYRQWLWRSFIPGWRAAIEPAPTRLAAFDLVCLGFPKWTLACPPLNQYLRLMECPPGTRLAPFMCYGGFDQERYFEGVIRKLVGRGGRVVARLALKRRYVQEGRIDEELARFCSEIQASLADGSRP